MSHKIVCLGGTGQMVLHYYLQLYLLGLIRHRFDAVVIDTDEINGGILRAHELFQDLQYGNAANQALGIDIPTIETYRVTSQQGGTALQRLTDSSDAAVTRFHPARAFFDKETLAQDLKEGLFARPALSSVVSLRDVSARALSAPDKATVVVVGSVIGGTGGGLIAPVIDELLWQARGMDANLSLRAVLFGKYFTPNPKHLGEDVESRFFSNEILVLRSIREALADEGVERFYIVRRAGGADTRKPDQEKKGEHLPWPDSADQRGERNPFWEGAQALEYLLTDTTTQRFVRFEDREVQELTPPVPVGQAIQQLKKSIQVAGRLVDRKVVQRMVHEPWLGTVWGRSLPDLYAHFWGIAARAAGEQERVRHFPAELQEALRTLWEGRKGEPGLRQLFPDLPRSHRVLPRAYPQIPWPRSQDAVRNGGLFESLEKTARRAAATLLFWSLREGL
jgi:hypothetical protein